MNQPQPAVETQRNLHDAIQRWIARLAVLFIVLFVLTTGTWLVWRQYWSGQQLLEARDASDDKIRWLLFLRARCDSEDHDNKDDVYTILHYLCMQNRPPDIIQLAIDCGADPHAKTSEGETPIDLAVMVHSMDAMSVLLGTGAVLNLNHVACALDVKNWHGDDAITSVEYACYILDEYIHRTPGRNGQLRLDVALEAGADARVAHYLAAFNDAAVQARIAKYKKLFDTRLSCHIEGLKLKDAVNYLSTNGVSIQVDETLEEGDPINLEMRDCPLGRIMHWMRPLTGLYSIHFTERDGGIFITTSEGLLKWMDEENKKCAAGVAP